MLQSDDMAIEHSMLALEVRFCATVHDYESRQRAMPECVYRRTMTRTEKLWATNFVRMVRKRSECCRAMNMAVKHSMLALECASAPRCTIHESRQRAVPECVYRRTMTRTEKLWATNFVNVWKRTECCRAMTWPSSIACLRWSALLRHGARLRIAPACHVPECVYRRTMTRTEKLWATNFVRARTEKLWATNFVNGWKRSECCRAMNMAVKHSMLALECASATRCTITSRVSELCLNVSTGAL